MSGILSVTTGTTTMGCTDGAAVDEPACALVENGWQYVAEASPVPEYCVNAGGDRITGQADNAACQLQAGGYEWTGGQGSSGHIVLRTGSATSGVGGSVSVVVGSGFAVDIFAGSVAVPNCERKD